MTYWQKDLAAMMLVKGDIHGLKLTPGMKRWAVAHLYDQDFLEMAAGKLALHPIVVGDRKMRRDGWSIAKPKLNGWRILYTKVVRTANTGIMKWIQPPHRRAHGHSGSGEVDKVSRHIQRGPRLQGAEAVEQRPKHAVQLVADDLGRLCLGAYLQDVSALPPLR